MSDVAGYFSYAQQAACSFDRPHGEPLRAPLEAAAAWRGYEHDDGSCFRYDSPDGWLASESPFARRVEGSGEDDGYVVTLAVHAGSFESRCWLFSACDVDRGPLARVRLPARVPTGFHAEWIPADKLWPDP
ncbi:MAG: carotenoid oxygenase family protein [Deltaproteobacteria bacterium]|nr:carotenoid oxygenase family protein [Deltaproteobacteria bacterium]